jgi:hypothetical protein
VVISYRFVVCSDLLLNNIRWRSPLRSVMVVISYGLVLDCDLLWTTDLFLASSLRTSFRGRRGRMVVGFLTTYVISAYHH